MSTRKTQRPRRWRYRRWQRDPNNMAVLGRVTARSWSHKKPRLRPGALTRRRGRSESRTRYAATVGPM